MFLFVMVVFGIQHDRMPVPNILPWLSGLGIMLGLKSVKVLHPLMSLRQALHNSSGSRLLGFQHPSTRHSFKDKAHRVTKVGIKKGKRGACRQKAATVLPDRTAAT